LTPISMPDTRPQITSDDALKIAERGFSGPATAPPNSELLIYQDGSGKYRLAYHVQLQNLAGNDPSKMDYFIDAKTGQMINSYNSLPILVAKSIAAGNGNTGVVPPQLGGSAIPGTSAASRGEGNVWGTRVMPDGSTAPRRTGGSIMAERARKG